MQFHTYYAIDLFSDCQRCFTWRHMKHWFIIGIILDNKYSEGELKESEVEKNEKIFSLVKCKIYFSINTIKTISCQSRPIATKRGHPRHWKTELGTHTWHSTNRAFSRSREIWSENIDLLSLHGNRANQYWRAQNVVVWNVNSSWISSQLFGSKSQKFTMVFDTKNLYSLIF